MSTESAQIRAKAEQYAIDIKASSNQRTHDRLNEQDADILEEERKKAAEEAKKTQS